MVQAMDISKVSERRQFFLLICNLKMFILFAIGAKLQKVWFSALTDWVLTTHDNAVFLSGLHNIATTFDLIHYNMQFKATKSSSCNSRNLCNKESNKQLSWSCCKMWKSTLIGRKAQKYKHFCSNTTWTLCKGSKSKVNTGPKPKATAG